MKIIKKSVPILIDPVYDSTSIFISLDVKVESSGVLFNKINEVYYNDNTPFSAETTPKDFKIVKKGSELRGKKVTLYSRYNVVAPTDDAEKFPKITWSPDLEAGDHTLYDTVEEATSDDNTFEFKLIFEFK